MIGTLRAATLTMLLACLGNVCAQLDFTADPMTIKHGLTDSLNLTCIFTKTLAEMYEVDMLIKHNDTNVAGINPFTESVSVYEEGWVVSGNLTDTVSFLNARWNKPSGQQAGHYTCQAIMYRTDLPGTTSTLTKDRTVEHEDPTIDDLAEVIGEIKDEIDDIEEKLDHQESVDTETATKMDSLQRQINNIPRYYG